MNTSPVYNLSIAMRSVAYSLTLAIIAAVSASYSALGLSFGVLALAVLFIATTTPVFNLCLAFFLFFFVPFDAVRFQFPLLNSPLDFLVTTTAVIAMGKALAQRRNLPSSPIYLPFAICVSIIVVNIGVGHGAADLTRLNTLVLGSWPFFLTILTVRNGRQAAWVLRTAVGSVVCFAALWLPLLLQGATGLIREISINVAWGSISLNYLSVVSFATVVPMLTALTFFGEWSRIDIRILLLASLTCLIAALLASSFAVAAIGTAVGCALVPLSAAVLARGNTRRYVRSWYVLLVVLALILLLVSSITLTPQGLNVLSRVTNPVADASGNYRLYAINQGIGAFLASPFIGTGAHDTAVFVQGYLLAGHNTYITPLYEYGLVYIVPFLWLLASMIGASIELINRVRHATDFALAMGVLASVCTMLVMGLFTIVFDGVIPTMFVWLFLGLATVWNSWLRIAPSSRLIS